VGVVGVGLLSWNLEPSAISFSCNNNHMDCEPVMHFYWLLNYASKIQLMEQVYSASNRTLNTENALFCKKLLSLYHIVYRWKIYNRCGFISKVQLWHH